MKNDQTCFKVCTVSIDSFQKADGPVGDDLNIHVWSNNPVNSLLAWMGGNQVSGADGKTHFLKTRPEIWTPWVTPFKGKHLGVITTIDITASPTASPTAQQVAEQRN